MLKDQTASKLLRRQFLRLVAGAAILPVVPRIAAAYGAYPARPVRIIVGFAAGGTPDFDARLIGQRLSERFGQPFITENRPGAGTNIATEAVVRAPADRYALLLVTAPNAINATLYDNLNFNFIRDVAPVASTVRVPFCLLVNPSLPCRTVPEFIAYAKSNPNKISFGSPGIGTLSHLAGELFKFMTGVNMIHVPYRGGGPSLFGDLLSGQIQVSITVNPALLDYIQTGKLRALAVTSATRSEMLPSIPTLGEFVPGYEVVAWEGIGAPKNTPTEIIAKLNQQINVALADPAIQARYAGFAAVPMSMSPVEFGKFISDETEKWAKVIKFAGIKSE